MESKKMNAVDFDRIWDEADAASPDTRPPFGVAATAGWL